MTRLLAPRYDDRRVAVHVAMREGGRVIEAPDLPGWWAVEVPDKEQR